jgi:hypothetical protein
VVCKVLDSLLSEVIILTGNSSEHLATLLMKDEPSKKAFQDSFLKAKLGSVKKASASDQYSSTFLRPLYRCLDCFEEHSNGDRTKHSQKTEHNFCKIHI